MSSLTKLMTAVRKPPQGSININGYSLTLDNLVDLGDGAKIELNDISNQKLLSTRAQIDAIKNETVYGITTGFGRYSTIKVDSNRLQQLQYNLIRSHAIGTGDALEFDLVKRMHALRINSLSKGFSGLSPPVLYGLIDMFNNNIIPHVPTQGTVGASGDLAPLSFLALALIGEGKCWDSQTNQFLNTEILFNRHQIVPPVLQAKDGLSLINGTQFITAVGSKALQDALNLIKIAQPIAALSFLALKGTIEGYYEGIHRVRNHEGQILTAEIMRKLLPKESIQYQSGDIQDPYCLRCVPQVHGPVMEQVLATFETFEREFNAATDNPLVFQDCIMSGGNFHGEYPAKSLDALSLYVFELGSISFGRIRRILNIDKNHGLPTFIAPEPGISSGFMIWENVAAACLAENRGLVNPASVDSHSTGADKEDHVSMGGYSARKANSLNKNLYAILAVELVAAVHACDLMLKRGEKGFSLEGFPVLKKIFDQVIKLCPPMIKQDRFMYEEYQEVIKFLESQQLLEIFQTEMNIKAPQQRKNKEVYLNLPLMEENTMNGTKIREFQTQFGQLTNAIVKLKSPSADDLVQHFKNSTSKVVILDGSEDNIGSRANYGTCGDDTSPTAYDQVCTILANFQVNKLNRSTLEALTLLGSLDLSDLRLKTRNLKASNPQERKTLIQCVKEIEHRQTQVCDTIFKANKKLVYMNGPHNNMKGVVSSFFNVKKTKPIVINLDFHSDCRKSADGPHSGTWGADIMEAKICEKYYLIGMNVLANSDATLQIMDKYNVQYQDYTFDKIQGSNSPSPLSEIAQNIISQIKPSNPIILTICMDSLAGIPCSAMQEVVGYPIEDVYPLIAQVTSNLNVEALVFAEYDPSIDRSKKTAGAEFIAQSTFLYAQNIQKNQIGQ